MDILSSEFSNLSDERLELLARVAHMYYEQGMTQHRISSEMGYSRSAISRFLTEARQVGIVEIRINYPLLRKPDLEQILEQRFNLRYVRVLSRGTLAYSRALNHLGALGARLLESQIREGSVLGVSWGSAVYEVAHALRPPARQRVTVVQMIGALGTSNPEIDGPELARWIAQVYGGSYRTLPAPLIVDDADVRDALLTDRNIAQALDLVSKVDIAVVGIGTVDHQMSSLVRAGYLTADEIDEIAASGAVGDVCAIHFDRHGNVLDIPIARRTIGIHLDRLCRIPLVLGVAGGEVKAPAILGALRGQLINSLIVDDVAARRVLELAGEA